MSSLFAGKFSPKGKAGGSATPSPQSAPKAEAKATSPPAPPKAEAKVLSPPAPPKAEAKAASASAQPKAEVKAASASAQPKAEAKAASASAQPKAEAKAASAAVSPKAGAKPASASAQPKAEAKVTSAANEAKAAATLAAASAQPKAEAKSPPAGTQAAVENAVVAKEEEDDDVEEEEGEEEDQSNPDESVQSTGPEASPEAPPTVNVVSSDVGPPNSAEVKPEQASGSAKVADGSDLPEVDVTTTVTGTALRNGDVSSMQQGTPPRSRTPSQMGAGGQDAKKDDAGSVASFGSRKSAFAVQPMAKQQARSKSYLTAPFVEEEKDSDAEAKAHTIRSFARWASGGNWDLLRDLYKSEPSEISAAYGALRKKSERRSVAFTEAQIQHLGVPASPGGQRRASSVPRSSVVSFASNVTSHPSSGSRGSRTRAASLPRSSVFAVPGGTVTAGSSRPSTVAGAQPRRSLSPHTGTSTQQSFVEDLRSGVDSRKNRKSLKTPSREVSCKEFVHVVRKNGFQGNTMTIFSEIQTECSEIAHMRGKKGETVADDTTTIWQFQSFQKRLDVVKETFACYLRLKRGTSLRAWRLDIDIDANGKGKSKDFIRYCKSLGLEEQGKFIVHSIRDGGEVAPIEFHKIDPGEAMNAEAFAERLLSSVHWDVERAWQALDPNGEGAVSFEQFRTAAKKAGFSGQIRPVFEGLDMSGQGRLWRDDIEYLWVLTVHRLQKRREEAQAIEYVEGADTSLSKQNEVKIIGDWEPSEDEAIARDFAMWASTNWDTIYELFAGDSRRFDDAGVTAVELERWLHMLGYFADIAAIFLEISRERPRSGDYDESVVTKLQVTAFRQRRNNIALKEFAEHLIMRRGSSFRAWKLDLDLLGTGLIEHSDFLKAARRVGIGDEVVCVWDYAHMDAGSYIQGTKIPICFHDLFPEESENVQSFAETLLEYTRFDLRAAWDAIDENGDGCITLEEMSDIADRLGWGGDVELIYSGLASNNAGYLWPQDLDYLWVIALHRLRMKWTEPPIHALSASRQAQIGGPFHMLGKLGLDHRGLGFNGEEMTIARICRGLDKIGYTGNVVRAAAELIWKVLSGHDVDALKSAKGKFSKPTALKESKPTWIEMLDRPIVRNPNTKSIVNMVFDGDKGEERRRRVHNWHEDIRNKRERMGLRGRAA